MARLDFVTVNSKEDTLASGQTTSAPRTIGSHIFVPKAPTKKPTFEAPKLALNDATADFAVICDDHRFIAHRSVLIAACTYFQRMFRFNGTEASKKEVEIKGVNRYIMKWILDFMYAGKYALPGGTIIPSTGYCNHMRAAFKNGPPTASRIFKHKCCCAGKTLSPQHLLPHIQIYPVADYFNMADLKTFARQGVIDVLHVYWNDNDLELKDALEEAFSNTPNEDHGLRQVLIDVLKAHPGLWVDAGDVRFWLDDHRNVLDEVDCD